MKANNTAFDDIKYPRFSPDGKQIVFDIDNTNFYERGRIYLYNLESKELATYKAPEGQSFEMASFSDDGQKLVFITSPIGNRNSSVYKQRNEILRDYQVATMNIDGSDMKVLTSDKSLKIFPSFSHKGDKIIFAKAEKIRDQGPTPALFYNLWEFDLNSGKDGLFMRKRFSFYQMGYSTYFNDDKTVLLSGYSPSENLPDGVDSRSFNNKTNRSSVFKIKRNQVKLDMPILMEFLGSGYATIDMYENIYFYADEKKEGLKLRKLGINSQFSKWDLPIQGSGNTKGISISKDGSVLVYSYLSDVSHLMLLNTHTGDWSEIILPKRIKEIHVKPYDGVK